MKYLLLLILMCAGLIGSAQDLHEAGVSKALAEYRKATVGGLKYELSFSVPQEKSEPVTGAVKASFELKQPTEIVLDFRAEQRKVKEVKVNGKRTAYSFENEHIIISPGAVKAGKNEVSIAFESNDQSLNRSSDYLYTLFVPDRARTAFPCFDQPDLKASFRLSLQVPKEWTAVSNTVPVEGAKPSKNKGRGRGVRGKVSKKQSGAEGDGYRVIQFAESEPLPTYLFAFAAGRFDYQEYSHDGRKIGAYYRETDPKRIGQLPEIFRQVEHSLQWQEEFTGVPYPFAKYDLVILPGFQFGGMEHTGATFYNDNTIFLSENPTPDEVLSRANLIAHETTHMWFGDYVTMRWFDDVWTKEVFANYFAAEITTPLFPDVNHDLNRLKTYAAAAYSEDRTWATPLRLENGETLLGGGTSIRQPLDNLRNAGLVYNNIIYNKAPLMMGKLVEIMGREAFREGIREYVKTFAYANATWDELVEILDRHTAADIKAFSRAWVNEKGMPTIALGYDETGALTIKQSDPYGRGLTWPQSFAVTLSKAGNDTIINVTLTDTAPDALVQLPAKWRESLIIPNTDGRGYGLFTEAEDQTEVLVNSWQRVTEGTGRQAVLMNLHENYLVHNIKSGPWIYNLIQALKNETDPLTASTICSYLGEPLLRLGMEAKQKMIESHDRQKLQQMCAIESELISLSESHPLTSVRTQLMRLLMHTGMTRETVKWLYDMWDKADNPLLSQRDYMALSYEVAIRYPSEADQIISRQRERLEHPTDGSTPNADRLREFDFISRAVVPSRHYADALFEELLTPEGRRIEPWAASVIALLNHPLREGRSVGYILPALNALEEVQRTGDIFFPANWCRVLLGEHMSPEARQEVEAFLNAHPDYLPLRRNKILNGAYNLFR